MSDTPVSIYDHPPPALKSLRDAIVETLEGPFTYREVLLAAAANQLYAMLVEDHYKAHHQDGRLCDCRPETPDLVDTDLTNTDDIGRHLLSW